LYEHKYLHEVGGYAPSLLRFLYSVHALGKIEEMIFFLLLGKVQSQRGFYLIQVETLLALNLA